MKKHLKTNFQRGSSTDEKTKAAFLLLSCTYLTGLCIPLSYIISALTNIPLISIHFRCFDNGGSAHLSCEMYEMSWFLVRSN